MSMIHQQLTIRCKKHGGHSHIPVLYINIPVIFSLLCQLWLHTAKSQRFFYTKLSEHGDCPTQAPSALSACQHHLGLHLFSSLHQPTAHLTLYKPESDKQGEACQKRKHAQPIRHTVVAKQCHKPAASPAYRKNSLLFNSWTLLLDLGHSR